jgi:hypothetical protein
VLCAFVLVIKIVHSLSLPFMIGMLPSIIKHGIINPIFCFTTSTASCFVTCGRGSCFSLNFGMVCVHRLWFFAGIASNPPAVLFILEFFGRSLEILRLRLPVSRCRYFYFMSCFICISFGRPYNPQRWFCSGRIVSVRARKRGRFHRSRFALVENAAARCEGNSQKIAAGPLN